MDERLQDACNLEKTGDYQAALDAYLQLEAESASEFSSEDRLFLARSIAACFFYLKNYSEAERRFECILADEALNAETSDEIESCLFLCLLYGGHPEKAKASFQKRVQVRPSAWDFWYLGQCCFLLQDYAGMADCYERAVRCAEQENSDKVPFFMCHLVIADLLNNSMDDAGRLLNRVSFMQKETFGLFKIASALYAKKRGALDWKKQYSAGVRQAKKAGYIENIELAEFLLKELG